jgi:hypothetical protein
MYGDLERMWQNLAASPPARSTIAIANLGSGPGRARDARAATSFESARAAGIRVIGYVYTRYGARPLSRVRRDITRWKRWYGVDGIFVDNVTSTRAHNLRYYRAVSRSIRSSAGDFVLMNGWATPEYMALTDVLLMFEGNLAGFHRFTTPAWTRSFDASRFASIVYGVRGGHTMRSVLDAASARNVGVLDVTDGRRPHQYRYLPSYLATQDAYLRGRGGCGG